MRKVDEQAFFSVSFPGALSASDSQMHFISTSFHEEREGEKVRENRTPATVLPIKG